ncbi:DUF4097 family beta strand repeat-containing protein [Thalassobacillus sp. B23F22_16]|uniref:DUF4097 family beta strand repeat-containing protein n=1 Tax=Thalassobacillus sp. B23F22_16 TaxID=3459513 RepID=UPI00373F4F47
MKEERLRILKMIEDGTISAEEGSKLLDALNTDEQTHTVSKQVDWENGAKSEKKQPDKKKKNIMDYVEQAFQKIKNADFDLNFGDYVEVSHIYQNVDDSYDRLTLSIANGSLTLKSWKESATRVECEAKVYQAEDYDAAKKSLLKQVDFKVADNNFTLSLEEKKIKADVTVYVPESLYEKVHAKLFNGAISLERLELHDMELKTSNGSIHLDRVNGVDGDIETSNGTIHVKGSSFDELEADTINGSVKLSGDFGKLDASTVTGGVTCEYFGDKAHTGFFQTTTGSINVHLPHHVKVDGKLQTNMGSLKCNLDHAKIYKEKNEVVRKELLFVINEQKEKEYYLEAETKTGSVTVE